MKINLSDSKWRNKLTPEQFHILREKGTEPPFTGKYTDTATPGVYFCVACGQKLFSSSQKYQSSCGWASFWEMADEGVINFLPDKTHSMERTHLRQGYGGQAEVQCSKCGGHLGHIFDDPASLSELRRAGGPPNGKRYCINSEALDFRQG